MLTYFINLPSVNSLIEQVGTSSAPMFTALTPILFFGAGISIGCILIGGIIGWLLVGVTGIFHREHKDKFEYFYVFTRNFIPFSVCY